MITPRIKPSSFFPEEAADDPFVAQQRKAKLEGYVQTLARNALAITLQCAAYNARRLVWLVKSAGASARPA